MGDSVTLLTIGQAARAAKRSKSTIWRAIKAGELSAARNADGTFAIDPAEIARIYPATGGNGAEPAQRNAVTHAETGLEREIALLREMLADVREDRDRWRSQAERLLLAAPEHRSWWRRWFR